MARVVTDSRFYEALAKAFDLNLNNVRRVVIDIRANETPKVYVEQWTDDRILDVIEAFDSVQIIRVDAPE